MQAHQFSKLDLVTEQRYLIYYNKSLGASLPPPILMLKIKCLNKEVFRNRDFGRLLIFSKEHLFLKNEPKRNSFAISSGSNHILAGLYLR